MKTYIFGAKATAAGLYKALALLSPDEHIEAFLVSKREDNPERIWDCPVRLLEEVAVLCSREEKRERTRIYVAVPELIHQEVRTLLVEYGFTNLVMIDSQNESNIMEQFYKRMGIFPSIHCLSMNISDASVKLPKISVYAAAFYKDKPLMHPPSTPSYVKKLYLGCRQAKEVGVHIGTRDDFYDDEGDNISEKNPNRCEMTAHYWVWKNRMETEDEYVGICHYRRLLDIRDGDLKRLSVNDVDVVLPFPMVHFPDGRIQHTWYVPEKDWETMRQVLRELRPDYEKRFDDIFSQPYFYNYNMMIAKKSVFADYCSWLYPVLDRIEEISLPKGIDRADRYTAYMSESLTTLYFMCHQKDLKIYHTGRLLFT